jgi:predicted nucleotidyltransferase
MIEKILNEFVEECKKKFGKNLVSIVLCGSCARGKARETSDIDVLVIAKKLPSNVWEGDKIIEEITWKFFERYNECLEAILTTPQEIKIVMRKENPFFYGLLTSYKIIYKKKNFFQNSLQTILIPRVRKSKPLFIYGDERWEMEKIIEK